MEKYIDVIKDIIASHPLACIVVGMSMVVLALMMHEASVTVEDDYYADDEH